MQSYIEQYQSKHSGLTLHTWTEVQGGKKENFYITGLPGAPIPSWCRQVLRQKALADIANFPYAPREFFCITQLKGCCTLHPQ
jgi:hypothetical protein